MSEEVPRFVVVRGYGRFGLRKNGKVVRESQFIPSPSGHLWAVLDNGADKVVALYTNDEEAEEKARELMGGVPHV